MGNEALSEDVDLSHVDYPAVQQSPEFQRLRRTHRRFVFPVLGACLALYLVYVLLAVTVVVLLWRMAFTPAEAPLK